MGLKGREKKIEEFPSKRIDFERAAYEFHVSGKGSRSRKRANDFSLAFDWFVNFESYCLRCIKLCILGDDYSTRCLDNA